MKQCLQLNDGFVYVSISVCLPAQTWRLLGCCGTQAVAAGMCGAVRRLLIGYFVFLSWRLYCCSSQRKSRGERIISQLIPTLLISGHSLPQPLIFRRVNFFSLFSLFWVTNSLFPLLLLFRMARHYRHSFPESTEQEAQGESALAVKFPGEGGAPPHPTENRE